MMRLSRSAVISVFISMAALLPLSYCGGGGGGGGNSEPAPNITSFNLTPSAIVAGQTAQVTAVFTNGTGRVEPGSISMSSGVPAGISPTTTTSYVLTVTSPSGKIATQTQTLTVYAEPSITSLTITPAVMTAGSTAQITAQFAGGVGVLTPGNIPVESGTPVPVTPLVTTQYTLTVTPPVGAPITRTVNVSVAPAAVIGSFSATPTSIREGNSTLLSFTFSGGTGTISPGNTPVSSGSSLSVSPTTTTTYSLNVTNTLGTSVTAQATVSVIPRPVLTSSAPSEVAAGQSLNFKISGTDETGAALGPYTLDYGPAGMSVTATGDVTWNAALPMFDRTLDVKWQISVPSYPGVKLTGSTRVLDPSRNMPLRRTGTEIPVWNSGLVVGDLDGSGKSKMLVASRFGLAIHEWIPSISSYRQTWTYPFSISAGAAITAVAARDLDGDKKQEIFFCGGNVAVRLDGTTRQEAARYTGAASAYIADLKVADLERNGSIEVICLEFTDQYSGNGHVVVLDAATLTEKWRTADLQLGNSLAVGNVDNDPALEIVTAGGYVFDGITRANEWAYGPGFGRAVATGDLDGDGVEEIVGMADWDYFKGFSATLKSPIWEKSGFDFDALFVADVDGDGKAEIFVGDGQWGNVTGYRYLKGSNSLQEIFKLNSQDHGVTSIAVGDVDGDGLKEVIWGSGATSSGADVFVIASMGPTPTVKWTNSNPKQLDGPFIGGLLARVAPNTSRLMYVVPSTDSGYDGTRLIALDSQSGAFTVSKEWGSNWSRNATLALADISGSGIDRILLTTANLYDGYFTAINAASDTSIWTSASDIGTGVATVTADMNADGHPDMITATSSGYVYIHDVSNSTLIWKSTSLGACLDVAVLDLDGDGLPEVIALTSTRLVAFKRSSTPGQYIEFASFAITDGRSILIADTDGDGKEEILILGGSAYPYSGNSKITILDKTFTLIKVTNLPVFASSMHLEDLGTGRQNVVVSVPATTTEGPHLRALDARSGDVVWRSPDLCGTVPMHSLQYVDVDKTGRKAISFGTSQGMYLTR